MTNNDRTFWNPLDDDLQALDRYNLRKYQAVDIRHECKGPNKACRAAHKAGRRVHLVPGRHADHLSIHLPTYHYASIEEAQAAYLEAIANAPLVTTDEQLYKFRAAGIAYKLPSWWVDPTRRGADNWPPIKTPGGLVARNEYARP